MFIYTLRPAFAPNSDNFGNRQVDIVELRNEDHSYGLIKCISIHVDGTSQRQDKSRNSSVHFAVLFQTLHRDWKCCTSAIQNPIQLQLCSDGPNFSPLLMSIQYLVFNLSLSNLSPLLKSVPSHLLLFDNARIIVYFTFFLSFGLNHELNEVSTRDTQAFL